MNECILPDPSGFFEIRFESIGGLGAHAAGQILARAAVLKMNLNGSHFSSYGSEKKGSVIRSYMRLGAAEKPIRTSAPIDSPDVIVVFHGVLMKQDITIAGMKGTGTLIYNGAANEVPGILEQVDYLVNWRQDETTPAIPSSIIKLNVDGKISVIRP